MPSLLSPTRRTSLAAGMTILALGGVTSGCGTEPRVSSQVRPPALVQVSAVITADSVTVSPRTIGAGPVQLLVANQTGAAQRVTWQSAGRDGGFRQQTGPINPGNTAELNADLRPGEAEVRVDGEDVDAALLRVGRARPSSQDDLLQP